MPLLLALIVAVLGALISTRTVPEGGVVTIDGSTSITTTSAQLQWDLNANGVYGEIGTAATHGDELGRTVRFQTIGRDGSRLAAGFYPVYFRVVVGGSTVDSAQTSVQVINARPVILSAGGPYTAVGSSATLTASAQDPGGTPTTILWDLNLNGTLADPTHPRSRTL